VKINMDLTAKSIK